MFVMKFMIVLLAWVTLALAADLTEEAKAAIRMHAVQCAQQEGTTKEQAMALRKGSFEDADDKVKCFANCFLERAGFLTNGQLNADVVLQKLTPSAGADNVKAALAQCDSIKGVDKCDTGFQVYQCFYKSRAWV